MCAVRPRPQREVGEFLKQRTRGEAMELEWTDQDVIAAKGKSCWLCDLRSDGRRKPAATLAVVVGFYSDCGGAVHIEPVCADCAQADNVVPCQVSPRHYNMTTETSFQFEIGGGNEHIANVLSDVLGGMFGSLDAGVEAWRTVVDSMDDDGQMLAAAIALTVSATPEEGDIHPQRAGAWLDDHGLLTLCTAGGVHVRMVRFATGISISVDFRRDSKSAATQIAARLWLATHSQQAAELLAQCSADLLAAGAAL